MAALLDRRINKTVEKRNLSLQLRLYFSFIGVYKRSIVPACIFILLLSVQASCTTDPQKASSLNSINTTAPSDTITGKVIRISDGDTFHMLLDDRSTIKIRLHGIDCPEKSQPFYQQARNYLSELIFNKSVKIVVPYKDQYKRHVAFAYVDGISVNEKMLESGMAWHFTKHDKQAKWKELENKARNGKKGLWSDPHPIAPWKYRTETRVK